MRDLTSTGYFKPFFGAGVCFYFWHLMNAIKFDTLEAISHRRNTFGASSGNTRLETVRKGKADF